MKITQDYVPKEQLDKANRKIEQLEKENKTLKVWKEKALNWLEKHLGSSPMVAFIQHVGGIQKRTKKQEQGFERE
ncbi:plasmid recombination protein, partial [Bacillus licheniformis]